MRFLRTSPHPFVENASVAVAMAMMMMTGDLHIIWLMMEWMRDSQSGTVVESLCFTLLASLLYVF